MGENNFTPLPESMTSEPSVTAQPAPGQADQTALLNKILFIIVVTLVIVGFFLWLNIVNQKPKSSVVIPTVRPVVPTRETTPVASPTAALNPSIITPSATSPADLLPSVTPTVSSGAANLNATD